MYALSRQCWSVPPQNNFNSVNMEIRWPRGHLWTSDVRGYAERDVESKVTKRSERIVTREISS